jgi:hypothetical protein
MPWTGKTGPGLDDDHLVADDRGNCKGPPPDYRRIVIRLRYSIKGRCDRRARAQVKCLVNVHTNQPLTPPLRRIDRQQSVRWGRGAAHQDHGRGRKIPGADAVLTAGNDDSRQAHRGTPAHRNSGQGSAILPAHQHEASQDHPQGHACGASLRDDLRSALTATFLGSDRADRKDGPDMEIDSPDFIGWPD